MLPPPRIRPVAASDAPDLAALAHAAPDGGRVPVRVVPRAGTAGIAALYPGAQGFVADAGGRVVGAVWSSVGPAQVDGDLVQCTYLFGLRVAPAARGRGIGSALLEAAWSAARRDHGVVVAWGAVMDGNRASLRSAARAGFSLYATIRLRALLPLPGGARRPAAAPPRPVRPLDLPTLAAALNRVHHDHNFWRPCTPASLAVEHFGAAGAAATARVSVGANGALHAAALLTELTRVAEVTVLGHRALPVVLNRALAATAARLPLQPLLLRQQLLLPDHAADGEALLRALLQPRRGSLPLLLAAVDPVDPAWHIIRRLPGLSSPLHLVVRGQAPIQRWRPLAFA